MAVAEELHFGRAAQRLHIAQPSLSHQIRRLEQQLGVLLLRRTSRRVELTGAGQVLLEEGRRLLAEAQRVLAITRDADSQPLTIGFYGSAAAPLLPRVMRAFTDDHPSADISLRELRFGRLDELASGAVDVAFTRLLPGQVAAEIEVEVLTHEPRLVALPAGHPLAVRTSLRFAELRGETFITNPAVQEADPAHPARWLSEQQRHGLPGRVAATVGSIQELLTLVAAGRGVSLVPAPVARLSPHADVVYVAVSDADPAVVSLAWRSRPLPPIVRAFIATARRLAGDRGGDPRRLDGDD